MHISQARPNAGDYVMLGFPRNLALRRLNKKSFKSLAFPSLYLISSRNLDHDP
jgi:adenylate kinase family enzyme